MTRIQHINFVVVAATKTTTLQALTAI